MFNIKTTFKKLKYSIVYR